MRTLLAVMLSAPVATAADWPQWMGPTRDGIWAETGIVDTLPSGGPPKKWTMPLAGGYSGPAVADGCVFVMDYLKEAGDDRPNPGTRNGLTGSERIHCFDSASGQSKWVCAYKCPYKVSYPVGPRCTPTVHDGRVYALGTMGHLTCLDAEKGTKLWQHDFTEKFEAKVPMWGFAGHPLVYKNTLICLVGGPEALLAAFDLKTGDVVWKALSTPGDDGPGYCPPSIIDVDGVTQLIIWHPQAVVSLNPDTGKQHWKQDLKPSYGMSIMMPRKGGDLLFAGGIGNSAAAIRLEPNATASIAWNGQKDTALYPANSTPLIVDETIYGVDVSGHLRAVKLSNGQRLWDTTKPIVNAEEKPTMHGTAFIVKNGENYFLFNELGDLVIAKLTPRKYEQISQAHLIEPTTPAFNRTVVWSHPAFAEKCIFVRNDKEIACFSLAK